MKQGTEAPLTMAMQEWADAIRGDWSDVDGRSVRAQVEEWIAAIEGAAPYAEWTIEQWRTSMGVCPDGGGHWEGRWGHCETDEGCPSLRSAEVSR